MRSLPLSYPCGTSGKRSVPPNFQLERDRQVLHRKGASTTIRSDLYFKEILRSAQRAAADAACRRDVPELLAHIGHDFRNVFLARNEDASPHHIRKAAADRLERAFDVLHRPPCLVDG